jgi:uncharacterized protein (TIGR03435 family)
MCRAVIALLLVAYGVTAIAQAPADRQPTLKFDVASVRPSAPGLRSIGIGRPVNDTVRGVRATVRQLVAYAYNLDPLGRHDPEPVGGPEWAGEDQFDIQAKGSAELSFADAREMVFSLLVDRFRLRVHTERRELPVYALTLAKSDGELGRGLRRSAIDCSAFSTTLAITGQLARAKTVGPMCGLNTGGAPAIAQFLGVPNDQPRGTRVSRGTATIAELVTAIASSPEIDRKVVDRTGLSGTFDIDLRWVPVRSGSLVAAPIDVLSIFTAVQEQLGLKLVSQREPLEVVVIDAVERPTPD